MTDAEGGVEAVVEGFTVPFGDKSITCQRYNATNRAESLSKLIFTHGAGGGLSNSATVQFIEGFNSISGAVDVFQGSMNLKSRVRMFETVLSYRVDTSDGAQLAIGGRSMGARAAVMCAQSKGAAALILASYPLFGGKQGTDVRDQILYDLPEGIDVLFISGTADNMCPIPRLQEVRSKMKARSWLLQVSGADHGMSLKPKKAVGNVRRKSGELAGLWSQQRSADETEMVVSWDEEQELTVTAGWEKPEAEDVKDGTREGDEAGSGRKRGPSQDVPAGGGRRKHAKTKR